MKPGPAVLKFQTLTKDVSYLDILNPSAGISAPRDEAWLYVVDVQGCVFKRQLIEGRITRWMRVRSNAKGLPVVQVANETLEKAAQYGTKVTAIIEDHRAEWAS
jgi:hypothetical protein